MDADRTEIGIAVIWRDGRVLLGQRPQGGAFGGLWEFPGGKCRPGEEPDECAVREALEEVGLNVRVTGAARVVEHDYADVRVRLHFFPCVTNDEDPTPGDYAAIRWVLPCELGAFPCPAANVGVVAEIARGGLMPGAASDRSSPGGPARLPKREGCACGRSSPSCVAIAHEGPTFQL